MYQFSWSDIKRQLQSKARDNVVSAMRDADQRMVTTFADLLSSNFGLSTYSTCSAIEQWLRYNNASSLATIIADAQVAKEKQNMLQALAKIQSYGFLSTRPAMDSKWHTAPLLNSECSWVPAAYRKNQAMGTFRIVYGGVSMNISLVNAKLINPPPTSSYALSGATLNTQRANAAPNSTAQLLDNNRITNQAFFRNQQAASARQYPLCLSVDVQVGELVSKPVSGSANVEYACLCVHIIVLMHDFHDLYICTKLNKLTTRDLQTYKQTTMPDLTSLLR